MRSEVEICPACASKITAPPVSASDAHRPSVARQCLHRATGRLVEASQFWRSTGSGEVDCDFRICRSAIDSSSMVALLSILLARKNLVEFWKSSSTAFAAVRAFGSRCMIPGHSRQSSGVWGATTVPETRSARRAARHRHMSDFAVMETLPSCGDSPRDDIDDGGFARAIVPHKPDTLAANGSRVPAPSVLSPHQTARGYCAAATTSRFSAASVIRSSDCWKC